MTPFKRNIDENAFGNKKLLNEFCGFVVEMHCGLAHCWSMNGPGRTSASTAGSSALAFFMPNPISCSVCFSSICAHSVRCSLIGLWSDCFSGGICTTHKSPPGLGCPRHAITFRISSTVLFRSFAVQFSRACTSKCCFFRCISK